MRCSERNLLAIESCGGGGDPGLAARCCQHGLTQLPLLPGQGDASHECPCCPEEIPAGITGLNPIWFWLLAGAGQRWNVPVIPGSEGCPRSPSQLGAAEAPHRWWWPAVSTNWQLHLSQSRAMLLLHPSIHNPSKRARFSSLFLPGLPLQHGTAEVLIWLLKAIDHYLQD